MIVCYGKIHKIQGDLNPAKKAVNVYSLFALTQFEKNSDEGEKRILYEAGFKAFGTMLICSTIALAISIGVGAMIESIVPFLISIGILGAGMISFSGHSWRLEHGGSEKRRD